MTAPIRDTDTQPLGDHPHADPGDGRTECDRCGKWVFEAIHSCKGLPVTEAAIFRWRIRQGLEPCCDMHNTNCEPPSELCCHHCTEAAHDSFPIRHADGSRCVLAAEPAQETMTP